jgi:hypothetical protein
MATTSSSSSPPGPDPVNSLLTELKTLVAAVNSQGGGGTVRNPSLPQASVALDYLAVRELLGRADATEPDSHFVPVARNGNVLNVFDVPGEAADVAVFTGFGAAAEVVALGTQTPVKGSSPAYYSVTLSKVPPTAVITRLELRRGDGRPIRLGPRLEPN